ncbi:MAG TPA: peptide-methionine (S)-S-oxide reductase MsrA [Casimicrobiaceae bacterium]|nr:peptide-methionine (S)-S-oxide reductase MsrA [Casimicrobiaceae bacterium]
MKTNRLGTGVALFAAAAILAANAATLPAPTVDIPAASIKGPQTAVFAGGCFWGVEAVFRHVKGVSSAVSGYAGGMLVKPTYEQVGSGRTGHAESVEVTYDPAQVSYGQLLAVFFSVAHDPTQLDRQGPDVGTQYRSAIFYVNDDQKRVAESYIAQLDKAKAFGAPIVTQVAKLPAFYPAEGYHQNYLALHPTQPYIVVNDLPKLAALQKEWPALYVKR